MTQPSSQGPCVCPDFGVVRDCPRHAYTYDYVGQDPFKDHFTGAYDGRITADGDLKP